MTTEIQIRLREISDRIEAAQARMDALTDELRRASADLRRLALAPVIPFPDPGKDTARVRALRVWTGDSEAG